MGKEIATHNFDDVALMARWSHKHLGYLAGLEIGRASCRERV